MNAMQTRLEDATKSTLTAAARRACFAADLMSETPSVAWVSAADRVVLDPCAGYLPPDETFAPVFLTDEQLEAAIAALVA